jgi:hypothetical protein
MQPLIDFWKIRLSQSGSAWFRNLSQENKARLQTAQRLTLASPAYSNAIEITSKMSSAENSKIIFRPEDITRTNDTEFPFRISVRPGIKANRIIIGSYDLIEGVDFLSRDGQLLFRNNPIHLSEIPLIIISEGTSENIPHSFGYVGSGTDLVAQFNREEGTIEQWRKALFAACNLDPDNYGTVADVRQAMRLTEVTLDNGRSFDISTEDAQRQNITVGKTIGPWISPCGNLKIFGSRDMPPGIKIPFLSGSSWQGNELPLSGFFKVSLPGDNSFIIQAISGPSSENLLRHMVIGTSDQVQAYWQWLDGSQIADGQFMADSFSLVAPNSTTVSRFDLTRVLFERHPSFAKTFIVEIRQEAFHASRIRELEAFCHRSTPITYRTIINPR